jgi:hypothetical protein
MRLSELFALAGHWRASAFSNDFVSCAFVYSSVNADQLARERCCPGNDDNDDDNNNVNCAAAATALNTT